MHGNDHARRWLTLALLLTMAAVVPFPRSGPGADVISASFWLYGIAIVGFTVRQLVLRRRHGREVPVLKWSLLAVSVVGLYVAAAFLAGTASALVVLLVCLPASVALLVLGVRDLVAHARRSV
jgi:hypothetical protein